MASSDICMTPSSNSQLPTTSSPPAYQGGALQGRRVSTVNKGISWQKVKESAVLIPLAGIALIMIGSYLLSLKTTAGDIAGVALLLLGVGSFL